MREVGGDGDGAWGTGQGARPLYGNAVNLGWGAGCGPWPAGLQGSREGVRR